MVRFLKKMFIPAAAFFVAISLLFAGCGTKADGGYSYFVQLDLDRSALFVDGLHCHVLTAPPLRRKTNLRSAVRLFLESESRQAGTNPPLVSDEAMDALAAHAWPKNYLEFRQVLQRACATSTGGVIQASDVAQALDREGTTRFSSLDTPSETSSIDLLRPMREIERDVVRMVVDKFNGNQTEAAHALGISRTTVWRLLRDDAG